MLQFLFRLTISMAGAAALAVPLITLLGYFFPDPTRPKWQTGQPAELAQFHMRTTPQEEPVGRPTQAPPGTQEISKQTTSPAADIRSVPPSDGIPGPSAERDMGVRSNAHASEQQRQLGSAPMSETSPGSARVPIDNRNAHDQELPQVAQGALSEQNELAGAARASVSAQSSSNRSVASQNDNSSAAASAADHDTKIEPAAQVPSGAPIRQDRPAAAASSARGSGEQQQSMENLNTNKLSVAKHISIHYRRDSAPARADAQHLASWLASSGFGTPRLLTTGRGVASPVVRYFFKEDAEGVGLLVNALRSRDGSWRAEDCRSYRHKPPTGTIEVWPHA